MLTARTPLYLASSSPRRVAFLRELGLEFCCLRPPESAEPEPSAGEAPFAYTIRAARAKAESVLTLAGEPPYAVIAADTAVVLDGRPLGKPRDADEAFTMLSLLAGRQHTVVTGCALLAADERGERRVTFAVQSGVSMWACPEAMLRAYAACGEPLDKAGAYAVQGAGAFLVERIDGSWSNVVGLPLAELVRELAGLGLVAAAI